MISTQYARVTLAVLIVALIPTLLASYGGARVVEQPPLSQALPGVLEGRTSVPTARKATTILREFDSEDWVERTYAGPGGAPVTLLAVRSYDMKRLYHHPELAISRSDFQRAELLTLETSDGPIDVHVLEAERKGLAAYALLYRGQTVAHPFLFQLRVAPDLLLRGRRPLTLVFAYDQEHVSGGQFEGTSVSQILRSAVDAVRRGPD